MALQTFSIENDILEISPQDEIYRFDEAANKQVNREAPWAQECVVSSSNTFVTVLKSRGSPHYFKTCKISAVAIIKMVCRSSAANLDTADRVLQVIHARSGVPYEIMGLMQGKVMGDTLVIMDSFALPVQGTETRVNAANEANEYMVQYLTESERVGLLNVRRPL